MPEYVRVPMEPTPEMLKAGASTLDDFWKAQERGPTHVQEAWPGIVQIYAAMLAASPQGEGSSTDPAPIKPSGDTGELRERLIVAFLAGATQGILSTVRVGETTDEMSERLGVEAHKYADDLIQSERAG